MTDQKVFLFFKIILEYNKRSKFDFGISACSSDIGHISTGVFCGWSVKFPFVCVTVSICQCSPRLDQNLWVKRDKNLLTPFSTASGVRLSVQSWTEDTHKCKQLHHHRRGVESELQASKTDPSHLIPRLALL